MSYHKDLLIFCANEGLDPNSFAARRAFRTGITEPVEIEDGRALTFADIDALTGGGGGTFAVPCPYCRHGATFKIERRAIGVAAWHCFYCGVGDRLDDDGPPDPAAVAEFRRLEAERREERAARALAIWNECIPIRDGDRVRRYFAARGLPDLPPDPDRVLRFHPACPFGARERRPCLVALFRDVLTDAPRAIHRTALDGGSRSPPRMALGPMARAAVKLWPLDGDRLVVGEGIETVLAAATRIEWREPLRPAWAMTVANNIKTLPVIERVRRLRILVDNDENGIGPQKSAICAAAWRRAGRDVVLLTPNVKGADFNSLVRRRA